ncbi:NAD(P)H-dependent flavin oxidoreductase [Shouchella lonarensis]|uniref:Probable nitronate monooxygenase n=1 Tax=Shouchella lonarensis TaxID=1464122 RepID=A0A1G6HBK1_9BACI|nr:nitronate monooxygenase [Shouchella lonarensis]SDB90806.1 enoyl-[acyl-carrier protein] reductase II [Shouchella lonarensis]
MRQLCNILNIQYPLIQGGMGNISHPALVAAVSEAGGLGTIGCGTRSPEEVAKLIEETRTRTARPFAVNIALNMKQDVPALIDLVIRARIPVVSLSAGNPASYMARLKAAGIKVMCVVATVRHALRAEASGADVLVAEGFEAAGINSPKELTTFTLIPQIASRVNIPVVAAGGIADGRGLAAALSLGASGVQMGTRLIATKEAPYHDRYKQRIIEAGDEETIVIGRHFGQVRRVLKGTYSENIHRLESTLSIEEYVEMTSEVAHVKGTLEGDEQRGFMNSGQVAGLISEMPSVSVLFTTMMNEAIAQMSEAKAVLTEMCDQKRHPQ